MPELPEVESVRRGLADHITGAAVRSLTVLDRRILGTTSQRDVPDASVPALASVLSGAALAEPQRRGKFLWVPFVSGLSPEPGGGVSPSRALSLHLGMSGQLRIHIPDEPLHRHTRAVLDLESPSLREPLSLRRAGTNSAGAEGESAPGGSGRFQLRFLDQRIFGHLGADALVADGPDLIPSSIAHIARDPLDPHWELEATARRMQRSRSAVKAVLMDQRVVSGVGNIYADEALHRAGVHPLAVPARTRISRLRRVLEEARTVMAEALAQGGTSFDALYVHVNGDSGYFSRSLRVYGRAGGECLQCGEPVRRIVVGGRGTHFCPRCQPPQR
ncbi:bifunctional DNA-formamidopyrimidine glycosylase/DNA-(apurinic or apyrimidinic site) lyase [Brevibacterium album]|uniref:bifunctional DNA-formamidopyrimidine glycosylase/DNA-(apurinic or apyrimidinic site) lyase n=1 Tax=Brevibacterium album TaxID=417948 RepID=UPI00040A86B9|nr:bifunctional DNA-formamidopyrimidine glycosylase/DNA-(apurinic or apyrimidinic site) lyase [Brevibacterium album]